MAKLTAWSTWEEINFLNHIGSWASPQHLRFTGNDRRQRLLRGHLEGLSKRVRPGGFDYGKVVEHAQKLLDKCA